MSRKKIVTIIILILGFGGLFAAYQTRDQTSGKNEAITAVGSTALQPLVEAAAEQYTNHHPNATINVQGGGSGTGLSQIADGAVQMGNSDIFAQEKSDINSTKLVDHLIAVEGIAPVVNKDTGINNLSQQQLIAIFTGKITNWQQVGGKNIKITLINRTMGSGTRNTFEKYGLKGKTSATAQEQDSSGTVRQIVSTTPGAISYLALGYVNDSVKPLKLDHVAPTKTNIQNNSWPIWAYEHVYTDGPATGLTKQFITYLNSKEIQTHLFAKMGYIDVDSMKYQRNWQGQLSKE